MISIARKGALTSYIVVEFCWLSFLWIMWVATAGDVASTSSLWIGACDRAYGAAATFCDETKAIEALGFVTWFISTFSYHGSVPSSAFNLFFFFAVMAYSITLLIFAVMSAMRGHSSIWTNSVRQADFNAPAVVSAPVQPSYEVKMDNTGISQFSAPQGQFAAPQTQYPPYNAGTPVSGYGGTPQVQQQPMSPYPQV